MSCLILVLALPAMAQQPSPAAPKPPASTSPGQSAVEKAAAEKKSLEVKAASDRAASAKASAAMDAKIDAADRKMRRAMEGICSGCVTKRKRAAEARTRPARVP